MNTKGFEERIKLILEKTTPQAFLLWLFIFLLDARNFVILGFKIDQNLLSFIVLICIGLAFSSIIGKLKSTEVELDACRKANLKLRYEKGIPIDDEPKSIEATEKPEIKQEEKKILINDGNIDPTLYQE